MEDQIKDYWSAQSSSLHRTDNQNFYHDKAEEHIALMAKNADLKEIIDIGCGAGELLQFLSKKLDVKVGVDYSESMLEVAKKRLNNDNIALLKVNIFDYLPNCEQKIWIATGSINQYLDLQQMNEFLNMFMLNKDVKALYFFDCVDPIKYKFINYGLSYVNKPYRIKKYERGIIHKLHYKFRRFLMGLAISLGSLDSDHQKLPSVGMGYGYTPYFWQCAAKLRNLKIEIVSSHYYEYRYHVVLRKV